MLESMEDFLKGIPGRLSKAVDERVTKKLPKRFFVDNCGDIFAEVLEEIL